MSAPEKAEVVTKVSSSPLPKRKVLRELGIPKSTYYRWLRRQNQQGLEDRPGGYQPPWNRLTIQEERSVLLSAREMPELSCRQLAAWITDNQGFSVSESSVYRILGREGLVKRPEMRLALPSQFGAKRLGLRFTNPTFVPLGTLTELTVSKRRQAPSAGHSFPQWQDGG